MPKLRVDFNLTTSAGYCPANASGLDLGVGDQVGVYDLDTDIFLAEVVALGSGPNDLTLKIHFEKVLAES